MSLTGFIKTCGAKAAGVLSVWVAKKDDVTSFTLTSGEYSAVTMNGANLFKEYDFKKDEAELKIGTTRENGSKMVANTVDFFVDELSTTSQAAIDELANESNCGLIVIVGDNNGNKWVLGYSETHGKKRPAELLTGEATTGRVLTDQNGEVVTLFSDGRDRPLNFTGTVPVT